MYRLDLKIENKPTSSSGPAQAMNEFGSLRLFIEHIFDTIEYMYRRSSCSDRYSNSSFTTWHLDRKRALSGSSLHSLIIPEEQRMKDCVDHATVYPLKFSTFKMFLPRTNGPSYCYRTSTTIPSHGLLLCCPSPRPGQ